MLILNFCLIFLIVVGQHVEVVDELSIICRQSFESDGKVQSASISVLYK